MHQAAPTKAAQRTDKLTDEWIDIQGVRRVVECSAAVARCISPVWMEALERNSGPRHLSESAWVVARHA